MKDFISFLVGVVNNLKVRNTRVFPQFCTGGNKGIVRANNIFIKFNNSFKSIVFSVSRVKNGFGIVLRIIFGVFIGRLPYAPVKVRHSRNRFIPVYRIGIAYKVRI